MSETTPVLELKVGATYRAKRPQRISHFLQPDEYNDRTIVWLGTRQVQYDGPAVAIGRKRPMVTREAFLKWAGKELPPETTA